MIQRVEAEAPLGEILRHRLVAVQMLPVSVRQEDVSLGGALRRPGSMVEPEPAGVLEEHVEEARLGGRGRPVRREGRSVFPDEMILPGRGGEEE